VADRGRLIRYGGYWGNKMTSVDRNKHHCLWRRGTLMVRGRNPNRKSVCSEV